jgi:cystathionine beta-lyase/cystathionine gamma-synthase
MSMAGCGEMTGDSTRCVHSSLDPEATTGAVHTPIFQTSTYVQKDFADHLGYEYARGDNPTRNALQRALAEMESPHQEAHGFCFSSGMAAITTISQMLKQGDHIIACDDLYGGTVRLFDQIASRFGIETSYSPLKSGDLSKVVRENSKILWLESPTNPLLTVHDIKTLAAEAKEHGLLVVVDSTFATPILQRPFELGADLIVHSTTKYIGGHSDVIGGCLITQNKELAEKISFLQNAVGAVPAPMDCFLILRGLRTLDLRMTRHCENAHLLAQQLQDHGKVTRLFYPGLESHPTHDIAREQMKAFGGIISLEVVGGEEGARKFAAKLKLFATAESLGGIESLINHPWTMTHAAIPEKQRYDAGMTPGLIRLSVGIEDADDLWQDISEALDCL